MTGEELDLCIAQCKRQNALAQRKMYDHFSGKMFSVCMRYSNTYEDAQDTFQEAFVTVFQKIKQYKNTGSFEGWIRRIMVNSCLEKFRANKGVYFNSEVDVPEPEKEEPMEIVFSKEELLYVIQQLPERYRLVFNLYVMENLTHKEIAEELDISEGTSKSNLSRARVWLQGKLKESKKYQALPKQYFK